MAKENYHFFFIGSQGSQFQINLTKWEVFQVEYELLSHQQTHMHYAKQWWVITSSGH